MSQPGSAAADLDETLLDDGRVRPFGAHRRHADLAVTVLDEGRRRPDPDAAEPVDWPDDGTLPERLNERYEWIRRLDATASQAELFLVRVRASGTEAVVKRYRSARTPHPDLVTYLSEAHDHTVRHLEFGPGYEVMDHVPGGNLIQRREASPAGFESTELHAVAQQLAAALIDLHRHGLVHRDVKPVNVLVRPPAPLDVVLVDFGVAGPVGTGSDDALNPAYQPPESVLDGRSTEATDWWGLGMTLLELAAGEHPFEGLGPSDIRRHFISARAVDVSAVPDRRLRDLCQGLLCADAAQRWDGRQVGAWLVGQDPDTPSGATSAWATATADEPAAGGRAPGASVPYTFNDVRYHYRDDLAQGLTTAWDRAVEVLFARGGPPSQLLTWLEQFTDEDGIEAHRVVEAVSRDSDTPGHVRLLRVVRALDPTRPAIFRHYIVSRRSLRTLAHRVQNNEGDAVSVLMDLWNHRLLPTFDTALPVEAEGGGEALADLDREWRAERRRWQRLAARIGDQQAHDELDRRFASAEVLALCLRAALREPDDVAAAREIVREADMRLPAPMQWFSTLARLPEMVWVALLLAGHAQSRARTLADQREARERRVDELQMSASFREWSRRQNRPAALGWAVAGVCLLAVVWIALIVTSDAVDRAGDTAIGLAWVGAAICLGISLVAECLLASEVGGRFHARFSIPGAGAIALRPVGRWMQRTPLRAAGVILAVLAGTALVAVNLPQAIAALTTTGHVLWVLRRRRDWHEHAATEDAVVAGEASPGPSDTDAMPIGTT